ncbi:MAG: translocation/assembly module TamB domain-containing protein [Bacteroidetes bacterium]|nr:translocation/assembly module TamB domain-containing protein [Bacteroidota bacterium]
MSKPLPNNDNEGMIKTNQKTWSWWRFVKRSAWTFFALFFLFFMILQLPQVQNWAAKKATNLLSKELNTTVRVDNVRLNIINGILLENFYLEDLNGDTLLNSSLIRVDLDKGLFGLLSKKLEIEEMAINEADFIIRYPNSSSPNNLQFIVDYLNSEPKEISPQDTIPTKPFFLNINTVYLNDVRFLKSDSLLGQDLEVIISQGAINIDSLNLKNKRLAFGEVNFDGVQLNIDEFYGHMPWDSFLVQRENVYLAYEAEKLNPTDSIFLLATVRDFNLKNGGFELHNYRNAPVKITPDDRIDYQHLSLYDLDININDFSFNKWNFRGEVEHMDFIDNTGFELEKLSAQDVLVSDNRTEIFGLQLKTPYSDIGDTLVMKYNRFLDFQSFVANVRMDAKFNEAEIALADIMTFAPKLYDNVFFIKNREEVFELDGRIYGKINRLNGRNLNLKLQNRLNFEGKFNSRDLMVLDEQFMDLDVARLRTDMETLRGLIPSFNPPENFNKLGRFDFTGEFFGFFIDFAVTGKMRTPLGKAEMDMQMVLIGGRDNAQYSGGLTLFDFDMGTWSDDPNFGNVTFKSKVKEGVGLRLANANATLEGTIDSLEFKGYDYKNVNLNGRLNQNLFDGDLVVKDKNINLNFRGEIDFTDTIPIFDFYADINRLALKPLNLSKQDLQLSGAVDLTLQDIDPTNILGNATVRNFEMVRDLKDTIQIDSVMIVSDYDENGIKFFTVDSDILEAEINGNFDIETIPEAWFQFMERNYSEFSRRIGLKSKGIELSPNQFDFNVLLHNPKGLIKLADPNLNGFFETKIKGNFDSEIDHFDFDIEIPNLSYSNVFFEDIVMFGEASLSEAELNFGVRKTNINNKIELSPIALLGLVNRDTLEFGITSLNLTKILDNLNLNGLFILEHQEDYRIQLFSSNLSILSDNWAISDDNYILLNKNKVETKNLILSNKDRRILLEHKDNVGLKLSVENVDMSFINDVWIYEPLNFSGTADMNATVRNLFKFQNISAVVNMDSLIINDDNYGNLWIAAEAPTIRDKVKSAVAITKGNQQILAEGHYYPPTYQGETTQTKNKEEKIKRNYLDYAVTVKDFPIKFLEYFLKPSIADTEGLLNVDGRLYGPPTELLASGIGKARDVATTIVFLNTRFTAPTGTIVLSEKLWDASETIVYDQAGNAARVVGGITHKHLRDLGLDVRIVTLDDQFVALNTKEGDNDYIYGKGVGTGYAHFSGSFRQPEVYISATSAKGTKVVIPVSYSQDAEEVSFIKFRTEEKKPEEEEKERPEIRGLNIEMDLVMNETAEVEMVFDKYWGDVIKGIGNGNLKILMTRNGGFEMRGNYVVEQGQYLFTLMNLLVNKPFKVERGGTIDWTGDPYNAQLNLKAVYDGLNPSTINFIQEYLVTAQSDIQQLARNSTPVNLDMILTGNLLSPTIDFDIRFPDLPTELRNYVDTKLRSIRQNQNELNRQVFGLMVLGQFMPSDFNVQATDIGINTLSEMLSSQLSMYITEFATELLTENGFISGIDFNFGYSQYQFSGLDNPDLLESNSEIRGKLKLRLGQNNRWFITTGVNVDIGTTRNVPNPTNNSILTGEVMLEYILTKDRRLKLKIYNKTEPDIAGTRRRKTGGGLSFRKEFDSLSELFSNKK